MDSGGICMLAFEKKLFFVLMFIAQAKMRSVKSFLKEALLHFFVSFQSVAISAVYN